MSFAGLTWSQLWPILGVAGLAVTGLYLLKMRRRQVEVPFAALWDQVLRESESRRLWRRLRRILSWLLQLVLLALVGLALADPRPSIWLSEPRTLAIVLDRSASMDGRLELDEGSAGPTRLDAGVERVLAELDALGPNDQVLLILAGAEVTVPGPLGADLATLRTALEDLRALPGEADLRGAIALARNALDGRADPELLIVTDGALPARERIAIRDCIEAGRTSAPDASKTDAPRGDAAPRCRVALVEGPAANLAITAFAARRYPGDREKVEVLAQVHNLGDEPARARLEIEADGVSIGSIDFELPPGDSRREIVARLDAARDELTARLVPATGSAGARGGPSVLGPSLDDRAWAVIPPLDPVEVALVTDGTNLFLEGALLTLDDYVRLRPLGLDGASDPGLADADVVFFDLGSHPLPENLPATNLVLFDPHRNEPSPAPIAKAKELRRPRLTETDEKHPILGGVVFKDVNMSRGTSFELAPGDQALVSHLGEAIVALREGEYGVLQIGFDPRQSDLPMRIAFPVMVANAVDYFARRSAGFVAAVPVGASRELALADLGLDAGGAHLVEVIDPDGGRQQLAVQAGRFRMRASVPGIHRIRVYERSGDGAEPGLVDAGVEVRVAVNQSDLEASDLHGRLDELPKDALDDEVPASVSFDATRPWNWLVLLVIVLVATEWLTYHRRRTV